MLDRVSDAGAAAEGRLARVSVRHDLASVRRAWTELLARAPASVYQTPDWIAPWLATLGHAVRPVFGLGFDDAGSLIALLPLGLERRGGLGVARFLGGRDANTGLGVFDPAVPLDAADLDRLLTAIARVAGIDLYVLANQPAAWAGVENPLLALRHHPAPSRQHEADLGPDAEAVLARTLSRRTRKHIRQKEAKLAGLGPVRHLTGDTAAGAARIAAALAAQRAARFGRRGDEAAIEAFLVEASRPAAAGAPAVELHALCCGDTVVATFAAALHARHLSGLLISFADDPAWARFSPGELLLARVVARHCAAGTATLDLGVGEARYKDSFCPRAVPLFDVVRGVSIRGRLAAAGWRGGLAAKRRLKASPRLWPLLDRLRRAAARRFRPGDAQARE